MIFIFTSLIVLWIMRDPKFAEGYGWGQWLEADLEDGTKIPGGHTKASGHLVFNVCMTLERKA